MLPPSGLLVLIFLGYLAPLIIAQAPPPVSSTVRPSTRGNATLGISMLAHKLQGICAQDADLALYNSTCSASASSVVSDKPVVSNKYISEENLIKVKTQNRLMLLEAVNQAMHNTKVPKHDPNFGFDQLSAVFSIFGKVCPAIPVTFLQRIYHLYSHIHYKTAVDRTPYMPKSYQKWISRLVNQCSLKVRPFPILTDACQEKVLAASNCSSPICTREEHEFKLMRTDPIVDTVFKAFEVVQSVCFPTFNESYTAFHFFHLVIADTFTDDIKIRWANQVEDMNFWRRLLGPYFDTHLLNIERCTEGAIAQEKWHFRISRDSMPARLRLTVGTPRRV